MMNAYNEYNEKRMSVFLLSRLINHTSVVEHIKPFSMCIMSVKWELVLIIIVKC